MLESRTGYLYFLSRFLEEGVVERTPGSERLPPTIENILFGVAQEVLTNARIAIERYTSKIRLEVQDWPRNHLLCSTR